MIHLFNYKKVYNKEVIVNIKNYTFPKGLHWIQGVNGSGKSTLLKSIAALIPFEGEISIDGKIYNYKNPQNYCSLVSYSDAEPNYPEFLRGSELITFFKNAKNASNDQVQHLLKILSVENFCSKKIGTYSSGMIKKLSLALAFIGSPKILLLDEPFTTIDLTSNTILTELIKRQVSKGKVIIITSHLSTENLKELSPRIHILKNTYLQTN